MMLKTCTNVVQILFNEVRIGGEVVAQKVKKCGLDSAERKIKSRHYRNRKLESFGVSFPGVFVYQRTSGIRQAEQFGRLVESFAHGIILRFTDNRHIGIILHQYNL